MYGGGKEAGYRHFPVGVGHRHQTQHRILKHESSQAEDEIGTHLASRDQQIRAGHGQNENIPVRAGDHHIDCDFPPLQGLPQKLRTNCCTILNSLMFSNITKCD